MKPIIKIVIKSTSGYCSAEKAYNDKISIEKNAISYEYKPMFESEQNSFRKWSYRTTNPIFQTFYSKLVSVIPSIFEREIDVIYTDIGFIEFVVTYSDKTKIKDKFWVSGDEFKECFEIIRQMVPACEFVPTVLWTDEDYKD